MLTKEQLDWWLYTWTCFSDTSCASLHGPVKADQLWERGVDLGDATFLDPVQPHPSPLSPHPYPILPPFTIFMQPSLRWWTSTIYHCLNMAAHCFWQPVCTTQRYLICDSQKVLCLQYVHSTSITHWWKGITHFLEEKFLLINFFKFSTQKLVLGDISHRFLSRNVGVQFIYLCHFRQNENKKTLIEK